MDGGDALVIRMVLPGVPKAWQRSGERVIVPKSGAKPFVHHFTPSQTAKEQEGLRFIAQAAMRGRPPLDCAVDFRMTAFMPVPRSWSQVKQAAALAGTIYPTARPDLDNIAKMKDALTGIVWRDDSLVCAEHFWKVFSDTPRVAIEVRPLGAHVAIAQAARSPLVGVG